MSNLPKAILCAIITIALCGFIALVVFPLLGMINVWVWIVLVFTGAWLIVLDEKKSRDKSRGKD